MKIGVFYFSGTGNTEFVAHEFRRAFGPAHTTDIFSIENQPKYLSKSHLDKYDMLGFGAPVYGFNVPLIFLRFINRLPDVNKKRTFVFLTAAGDGLAAINYPTSILLHKGYHVINGTTFFLPSNVIVKKIENDVLFFKLFGLVARQNIGKMFKDSRQDVKQVTQVILQAEKNPKVRRLWMRLISGISRPVVYIGGSLPMKYVIHVTDNCDQCGICARACPTRNIKMSLRKVKFGTACTICYRCINICPRQAIQLRWPFGCFDNDAQYLAPGWKPPHHFVR